MVYADWLPVVICMVCVWLLASGCTLTYRGGMQSPPPTEVTPQMTLTVYEDTPPTATATRVASVRIASQPTATPHIYTVRSGDTLLDIALEFGMTVEDLQRANPNANPRTLQIGQTLIIPDALTVTTSAALSAPPPPLPIRAPACYPTPTQSVICMGVVINNQTQPIEQAQMAVQIMSADGEMLDEQITTIEQSVIPPEGYAPYRVLFEGVTDEQVGGVIASLSSAVLADEMVGRYVPLTIENEVITSTGRFWTVTGDIVNASEQTARPPRVVFTLYDDTLQVVGYRVWQGTSPLAAGQRVPLQIFASSLVEDKALQHTLHIEARALEPAG